MLSDDEKQKLIRTLRRIEGQAGGLIRMVEADRYCIDIIQQVAAMQGALAQASKQLLDAHLRTCLVTAFESKKSGERERMVTEIVDLFAKTMRTGPTK
tara:strand:+ start:4320 stop:4613 length:294 start_codon:yes stop_codon:yes gene_type:complete